MSDPRLYVSCSSYVAGRLLGPEQGAAYLQRLVAQPDDPEQVWFPCVRVIRLLRKLADVELRLDTGATNIGKSLSRHFTAAYEGSCDAWMNLDDDCETSPRTLAWLLAAIDYGNPHAEARICFAPYILRGDRGEMVCVEWSPIYSTRRIDAPNFPHGEARRAKRGATGLVVMNRAAMQALAHKTGPIWRDDGGVLRYPVAQEIFDPDGNWHGADFSLFERVPAGVTVEALQTGETMHASYGLDLGELVKT